MSLIRTAVAERGSLSGTGEAQRLGALNYVSVDTDELLRLAGESRVGSDAMIGVGLELGRAASTFRDGVSKSRETKIKKRWDGRRGKKHQLTTASKGCGLVADREGRRGGVDVLF